MRHNLRSYLIVSFFLIEISNFVSSLQYDNAFYQNFKCSKSRNHVRRPHKTNCQKYMRCIFRHPNRSFMKEANCDSGQLFDETVAECKTPNEINPKSKCSQHLERPRPVTPVLHSAFLQRMDKVKGRIEKRLREKEEVEKRRAMTPSPTKHQYNWHAKIESNSLETFEVITVKRKKPQWVMVPFDGLISPRTSTWWGLMSRRELMMNPGSMFASKIETNVPSASVQSHPIFNSNSTVNIDSIQKNGINVTAVDKSVNNFTNYVHGNKSETDIQRLGQLNKTNSDGNETNFNNTESTITNPSKIYSNATEISNDSTTNSINNASLSNGTNSYNTATTQRTSDLDKNSPDVSREKLNKTDISNGFNHTENDSLPTVSNQISTNKLDSTTINPIAVEIKSANGSSDISTLQKQDDGQNYKKETDSLPVLTGNQIEETPTEFNSSNDNGKLGQNSTNIGQSEGDQESDDHRGRSFAKKIRPASNETQEPETTNGNKTSSPTSNSSSAVFKDRSIGGSQDHDPMEDLANKWDGDGDAHTNLNLLPSNETSTLDTIGQRSKIDKNARPGRREMYGAMGSNSDNDSPGTSLTDNIATEGREQYKTEAKLPSRGGKGGTELTKQETSVNSGTENFIPDRRGQNGAEAPNRGQTISDGSESTLPDRGGRRGAEEISRDPGSPDGTENNSGKGKNRYFTNSDRVYSAGLPNFNAGQSSRSLGSGGGLEWTEGNSNENKKSDDSSETHYFETKLENRTEEVARGDIDLQATGFINLNKNITDNAANESVTSEQIINGNQSADLKAEVVEPHKDERTLAYDSQEERESLKSKSKDKNKKIKASNTKSKNDDANEEEESIDKKDNDNDYSNKINNKQKRLKKTQSEEVEDEVDAKRKSRDKFRNKQGNSEKDEYVDEQSNQESLPSNLNTDQEENKQYDKISDSRFKKDSDENDGENKRKDALRNKNDDDISNEVSRVRKYNAEDDEVSKRNIGRSRNKKISSLQDEEIVNDKYFSRDKNRTQIEKDVQDQEDFQDDQDVRKNKEVSGGNKNEPSFQNKNKDRFRVDTQDKESSQSEESFRDKNIEDTSHSKQANQRSKERDEQEGGLQENKYIYDGISARNKESFKNTGIRDKTSDEAEPIQAKTSDSESNEDQRNVKDTKGKKNTLGRENNMNSKNNARLNEKRSSQEDNFGVKKEGTRNWKRTQNKTNPLRIVGSLRERESNEESVDDNAKIRYDDGDKLDRSEINDRSEETIRSKDNVKNNIRKKGEIENGENLKEKSNVNKKNKEALRNKDDGIDLDSVEKHIQNTNYIPDNEKIQDRKEIRDKGSKRNKFNMGKKDNDYFSDETYSRDREISKDKDNVLDKENIRNEDDYQNESVLDRNDSDNKERNRDKNQALSRDNKPDSRDGKGMLDNIEDQDDTTKRSQNIERKKNSLGKESLRSQDGESNNDGESTEDKYNVLDKKTPDTKTNFQNKVNILDKGRNKAKYQDSIEIEEKESVEDKDDKKSNRGKIKSRGRDIISEKNSEGKEKNLENKFQSGKDDILDKKQSDGKTNFRDRKNIQDNDDEGRESTEDKYDVLDKSTKYDKKNFEDKENIQNKGKNKAKYQDSTEGEERERLEVKDKNSFSGKIDPRDQDIIDEKDSQGKQKTKGKEFENGKDDILNKNRSDGRTNIRNRENMRNGDDEERESVEEKDDILDRNLRQKSNSRVENETNDFLDQENKKGKSDVRNKGNIQEEQDSLNKDKGDVNRNISSKDGQSGEDDELDDDNISDSTGNKNDNLKKIQGKHNYLNDESKEYKNNARELENNKNREKVQGKINKDRSLDDSKHQDPRELISDDDADIGEDGTRDTAKQQNKYNGRDKAIYKNSDTVADKKAVKNGRAVDSLEDEKQDDISSQEINDNKDNIGEKRDFQNESGKRRNKDPRKDAIPNEKQLQESDTIKKKIPDGKRKFDDDLENPDYRKHQRGSGEKDDNQSRNYKNSNIKDNQNTSDEQELNGKENKDSRNSYNNDDFQDSEGVTRNYANKGSRNFSPDGTRSQDGREKQSKLEDPDSKEDERYEDETLDVAKNKERRKYDNERLEKENIRSGEDYDKENVDSEKDADVDEDNRGRSFKRDEGTNRKFMIDKDRSLSFDPVEGDRQSKSSSNDENDNSESGILNDLLPPETSTISPDGVMDSSKNEQKSSTETATTDISKMRITTEATKPSGGILNLDVVKNKVEPLGLGSAVQTVSDKQSVIKGPASNVVANNRGQLETVKNKVEPLGLGSIVQTIAKDPKPKENVVTDKTGGLLSSNDGPVGKLKSGLLQDQGGILGLGSPVKKEKAIAVQNQVEKPEQKIDTETATSKNQADSPNIHTATESSGLLKLNTIQNKVEPLGLGSVVQKVSDKQSVIKGQASNVVTNNRELEIVENKVEPLGLASIVQTVQKQPETKDLTPNAVTDKPKGLVGNLKSGVLQDQGGLLGLGSVTKKVENNVEPNTVKNQIQQAETLTTKPEIEESNGLLGSTLVQNNGLIGLGSVIPKKEVAAKPNRKIVIQTTAKPKKDDDDDDSEESTTVKTLEQTTKKDAVASGNLIGTGLVENNGLVGLGSVLSKKDDNSKIANGGNVISKTKKLVTNNEAISINSLNKNGNQSKLINAKGPLWGERELLSRTTVITKKTSLSSLTGILGNQKNSEVAENVNDQNKGDTGDSVKSLTSALPLFGEREISSKTTTIGKKATLYATNNTSAQPTSANSDGNEATTNNQGTETRSYGRGFNKAGKRNNLAKSEITTPSSVSDKSGDSPSAVEAATLPTVPPAKNIVMTTPTPPAPPSLLGIAPSSLLQVPLLQPTEKPGNNFTPTSPTKSRGRSFQKSSKSKTKTKSKKGKKSEEEEEDDDEDDDDDDEEETTKASNPKTTALKTKDVKKDDNIVNLKLPTKQLVGVENVAVGVTKNLGISSSGLLF